MYNYQDILKKIESIVTPDFFTLIEEFSQFLTSSKSPLTVQTYLQDLHTAIQFFQAAHSLPETIDQWRGLISKRYYSISPRTQLKFLASMKCYATFLKEAKGEVKLLDTISSISKPKTPKHHPKPISSQEIKSLLEYYRSTESLPKMYQKHPWAKERDLALWLLLYGCGLRISEALSLTLHNNQIQQIKSNQTLEIKGKGNKIRQVPLIGEVSRQLEMYLHAKPATQEKALFIDSKLTSLTRIQAAIQLKQVSKILNLPEHTTPHSLRHSFVSHLIEQKACLRAVQELVGHKHLSTIQNYASVSVEHLSHMHAAANAPIKKHNKN